MLLGMNYLPSTENDSPAPSKCWDADLHFLDRRGCYRTYHRSSSMKRLLRKTRYAARRNITGATPLHKSSVPRGGPYDVNSREVSIYICVLQFPHWESRLSGQSEILSNFSLKTTSLPATQELHSSLSHKIEHLQDGSPRHSHRRRSDA